MIRVACILPLHKDDYLVNTVLDGLSELRSLGKVSFFVSSSLYVHESILESDRRDEDQFIKDAREADIIFFFWGKGNTDREMADRVNSWKKTVYINGSEVGHNRRYDTKLQQDILNFSFKGNGGIEYEYLKKCAGYFRREKPYLHGVDAFPFGIERRYVAWKEGGVKDIDFTCIFGQEEYPPLRQYAREALQEYCRQFGFTCHTEKTKSRAEFYALLARTKVGISVGGGGYDTARFWEILGNNCLLLTETVDLFPKKSKNLVYSRIHEFGNLYDFAELLPVIGEKLKTNYNALELTSEYDTIMQKHSTRARVEGLLTLCRERGIIHE